MCVCVCVCVFVLQYILGPEHRVHSDRWFVQDEQLWILEQSSSEGHSALLTPAAANTQETGTITSHSMCLFIPGILDILSVVNSFSCVCVCVSAAEQQTRRGSEDL